ncbi:SH3 domain protein, partial [Trichinella nativa]
LYEIFICCVQKKRFENSIDEEDSEEQEQKADIVDPVYLALKHAQMISASKDDRHSLVADADDSLVEETPNKQHLVQELDSSKILPVASPAKVELNTEQIKRSMFFDKYVVIHEFRAKFPGELDLRLGDIIAITDVNDTDWWTGCKAEDVYGRFPKTSVERIRFHEQILLVKQNLHLWEEQRNIRLYRDQIVFGQRNAENGFVTVRTAKDHYINCPVEYLTPLT